jgi:uncharacterized protein (TIGR03437 family)
MKLSKFSGRFLYPKNQNGNALEVRFSQRITAVSLVFATADFQQVEVPTSVQLTAYLDSTSNPAVGSATAHGTYANDTMPMGTLSFSSNGQPFNLVKIAIVPTPRGAASFLVDNVTVTPAQSAALASVSAASYAAGTALAPGSIVSGFGDRLAGATEAALTQPLPTKLADTVVNVKDSAGAERPAPLLFVGPQQVNYIIPDGTASGPATVSVVSAGMVTATGVISIERVGPGLFTANFDGKGAPAGSAIVVAPDLTQTAQPVAQCGSAQGSCVTAPIDLGPDGTQVVLTLYGTGIRGRSSLAGVTAKIAGTDARVEYAGAQSQFAGLDQVNITVPRTLAGRGEVDVALTVDGKAANVVRVYIR